MQAEILGERAVSDWLGSLLPFSKIQEVLDRIDKLLLVESSESRGATTSVAFNLRYLIVLVQRTFDPSYRTQFSIPAPPVKLHSAMFLQDKARQMREDGLDIFMRNVQHPERFLLLACGI